MKRELTEGDYAVGECEFKNVKNYNGAWKTAVQDYFVRRLCLSRINTYTFTGMIISAKASINTFLPLCIHF